MIGRIIGVLTTGVVGVLLVVLGVLLWKKEMITLSIFGFADEITVVFQYIYALSS